MTKLNCSTCRFFQGPVMADEPGFETFGFCRRHPPSATVQVVGDGENEEDGRYKLIDRMASWQFPFLNGATEWCGEHAASPAEMVTPSPVRVQPLGIFPIPESDAPLVMFTVRMPVGMRDALKAAAKANGRTMNAEITHRLSAGRA